MVHIHSSTISQRARQVSELVAQEGGYGIVSQMSQSIGSILPFFMLGGVAFT